MAKRSEFQLEWQRLIPAFGEYFEALVGNMALDSGLPPPRSVAELQSWYNELVLHNETYEKKGVFMKQCCWFSILKLMSMHDKVWHARKWQAEQVASLVKGAHGKDFAPNLVPTPPTSGCHHHRHHRLRRTQKTHTWLSCSSCARRPAMARTPLDECKQPRKRKDNVVGWSSSLGREDIVERFQNNRSS